MKLTAIAATVVLTIAAAGCASSPEAEPDTVAEAATTETPTAEAAPAEAAEPAPKTYADPGLEKAAQVEAFVTEWVAAKTPADGVYDIPAQGTYDVSGEMADFHTVHRKDADTYYVCVDFTDGEALYDVDFFVDETDGGYALTEHYLHKVDGEDVTGK